jgi:hypothetical protein
MKTVAKQLKKHFQELIQQRIRWIHNDQEAIDKYRKILEDIDAIENAETLIAPCYLGYKKDGRAIKIK